MTTSEITAQRSRRALLTATLGAVAASVASALGRPTRTLAADGATVTVGGEFSGAVTRTGISSNTIGSGDSIFYALSGGAADGLRGTSSSGRGVLGFSTSSFGVYGSTSSADDAAVYGSNPNYYGVEGYSTNYGGVRASSANGLGLSAGSLNSHGIGSATSKDGYAGVSTSGTGVGSYGVFASATNAVGGGIGAQGASYGVTGYGVVGKSYAGSVGVLGLSLADDSPMAIPLAPKTGVYGKAAQGTSSRGVHGYSPSGRGVFGQATSGVGVYASATTGYAIRSSGRVRFDKAAGIATLGATASSIVVTPGTDLTSDSAVTATLMSDVGTVMVRRVAVNAAADTFTIVLTGSAPAGTRIAWHVFG